MTENIKVRWLTDHEQTKVAPKTLSSQVYNEDGTLYKDTVDEALENKADKSYVDNTKANKTDIVQADWNQNDDSALDYVKNRTHWVEDDGETYHPLDEKFLPDTVATKDYVEALYIKLNSNTVLGFYCVEDVTIVTNGISKVYPANSNVEISFVEGDTFEIIPTSNNSILALTAFPGALATFYPWLEGVRQFSNILFDMNDEAMYSKWSQGNQGSYQVQFAQYVNCIFWSDNPYISDVYKRTNYTLCSTSQLPLCYSSIPDNTFKSFYLAMQVNNDPNWGNQLYKDSFAKATWATQAFSYYGARTIGFPGHDSESFNIVLPKDCRGLMFDARNIENAGTFDATNTTNFGAKSGSWREAFGACTSLKRLYIKNLKVSLNISWSPIDYNSIYYIISAAANTSAITISVSPYTYNLLSQSDFELAASKNITIALLTTNYVEDKRLSEIANKADKTEVDTRFANLATVAISGDYNDLNNIPELPSNIAFINEDNNEDIVIDSETGVITSPLAGTIHRFSVEVNCAPLKAHEPTISPDFTDAQDLHTDYGLIIFPKTYTQYGKKTRLVIHCHGGGGKVDATSSQLEGQPITKYLVANGYACMDVNGLPQTFATANNLRIQDSVGSYIAMQSYHKAYTYCMNNFNLEPEVFIMGISEGGITGANLCMEGVIPVRAHAAWSPVLDTYNQIFLKPWQLRVGPAKTLAVLYGFDPIETTEKNDNKKWTYDEDKVRGYNPTTNHTITIDGVSYKKYPCPVKFWHCLDDGTVSYEGTANFIQAIKNAGGIAYLRTFETGGHEVKLIGDPIENPIGRTDYMDETLEVKVAMDETLLWFKRFD